MHSYIEKDLCLFQNITCLQSRSIIQEISDISRKKMVKNIITMKTLSCQFLFCNQIPKMCMVWWHKYMDILHQGNFERIFNFIISFLLKNTLTKGLQLPNRHTLCYFLRTSCKIFRRRCRKYPKLLHSLRKLSLENLWIQYYEWSVVSYL